MRQTRSKTRSAPSVVGIAGSYGGLNVGDEAILTVAVAELRSAIPRAEIVVFSRNPEHTRDILEARKFDDAIARGSYPIDIHDPEGKGTVLRRLPERPTTSLFAA